MNKIIIHLFLFLLVTTTGCSNKSSSSTAKENSKENPAGNETSTNKEVKTLPIFATLNRMKSLKKIRALAQAMMIERVEKGEFPPQCSRDKDGKPLLS